MYWTIHSNHRYTRPNRGNQKNVSASKRYTPPDRFMNRAPHIEIKETPKNLTIGTTWDRLSLQVWDKFLKCQQKEGTYTKKINMWKNMYCTVQVILIQIFIRKTSKIFCFFCSPTRLGKIFRLFGLYGRIDNIWFRFGWFRRRYVPCRYY